MDILREWCYRSRDRSHVHPWEARDPNAPPPPPYTHDPPTPRDDVDREAQRLYMQNDELFETMAMGDAMPEGGACCTAGDGCRVFYVVKGDREACNEILVCLSSYVASSASWRFFAESLQEIQTDQRHRFFVIVTDMMGMGHSRMPTTPITHDATTSVLHVRSVLQALGLEEAKVTLIGHSFGATVAVFYTMAYPERVKRLVLIAPLGLVDTPVPFLLRWTPRSAHPWLHRAGFVKVHPAEADHPNEQYAAAVTGLMSQFPFWSMQRAVPTVGSLGIPILLVWSREDRVAPFPHASAFLRAMPTAHLVILDGDHLAFSQGEPLMSLMKSFVHFVCRG